MAQYGGDGGLVEQVRKEPARTMRKRGERWFMDAMEDTTQSDRYVGIRVGYALHGGDASPSLSQVRYRRDELGCVECIVLSRCVGPRRPMTRYKVKEPLLARQNYARHNGTVPKKMKLQWHDGSVPSTTELC